MHQHRVEIGAHPLDDLPVPSRVVAHDHNVAHGADQARARPGGAHRGDQRVELEAEGAARERKSLDDHGFRSRCFEGVEQCCPPPPAQPVVERVAGAVEQLETRVVRPHRLQLHEAEPRMAQAGDRRAAADQSDRDAVPGQRLGNPAHPL